MQKVTRNKILKLFYSRRDKLDAALYAALPPNFSQEAERLKRTNPDHYFKQQEIYNSFDFTGWGEKTRQNEARHIALTAPNKPKLKIPLFWRLRYLVDNSYRVYIFRNDPKMIRQDYEEFQTKMRTNAAYRRHINSRRERVELEYAKLLPKQASFWKTTIPHARHLQPEVMPQNNV